MAKFHEKGIVLYGVKQTAEGSPAVRSAAGTGTITTVADSATVTGSGTAFTTELAVGCFLYVGKIYLGKVKTIASATSLTLEVAAKTVKGQVFGTAQSFTIGDGPVTTGTITTTAASATVTGTGTAFLTQLTVGGYIYTVDDKIIGRVASIGSDTSATLEDVVPASPTARAEGVMAISGAVTSVKFKTGLGPKNAMRAINMNYSTEQTSQTYVYVGDELDRTEDTVVTDIYAKMDFETFLPALGTIAGGDPVITEVPLVDWLQACGAGIVLSTGSGGYAKATNSVSSNNYLTIEVRRSSPDLATVFENKCFTITNARGNVDLDITMGDRCKLKYNFQGNLDTIGQKTTIVPNYGDQSTVLSANVSSKTITLSALALYDEGSSVLPAIPGSSNVCFDKLNAPNWTGFEFSRYLTGCEDGWSKGATATDVTITIVEDAASVLYNPDEHLQDHHRLTLRWGSVVGYQAELDFEDLVLAKVTNSKVANYSGQDLAFRNVGKVTFKMY